MDGRLRSALPTKRTTSEGTRRNRTSDLSHPKRESYARLLPQARETALVARGSLRGRGVCGLLNIGACGGRSVLRKGRSKSAADAKVRPCPYFRRGVTCGEMEGYVWREGGAKGWR